MIDDRLDKARARNQATLKPLFFRTLSGEEHGYGFGCNTNSWGVKMLGTILVILLILALIGAFPRWGYSSGWGYGPSGIVGVLLIVVLVLALTGRV